MSGLDDLPLACERRDPAGGAGERAVVLLHGLGADGTDLLPLADAWQGQVPPALFLAPHAPERCDMAPSGRQWFSLADPSPHRLIPGVQRAAPALRRFLEALPEATGVSLGRTALVGFSQGAMMALHVAPRLAEPVAGVLGYSGMLIQPSALPDAVQSRPPVCLVHGDADTVVEPSGLEQAVGALEAAGLAVESELRPGVGHGIDEGGLATGGAFLARVLGAR